MHRNFWPNWPLLLLFVSVCSGMTIKLSEFAQSDTIRPPDPPANKLNDSAAPPAETAHPKSKNLNELYNDWVLAQTGKPNPVEVDFASPAGSIILMQALRATNPVLYNKLAAIKNPGRKLNEMEKAATGAAVGLGGAIMLKKIYDIIDDRVRLYSKLDQLVIDIKEKNKERAELEAKLKRKKQRFKVLFDKVGDKFHQFLGYVDLRPKELFDVMTLG